MMVTVLFCVKFDTIKEEPSCFSVYPSHWGPIFFISLFMSFPV